MKRFPPLRRVLLVLLAGTALVSGCKKSLPLSPVSGTVTVNGTPVTSGVVAFIPDSKEAPNRELSSGQIDSSGNYKIMTGGKSGAPAGRYKVTVNPSMVPTGGGMPQAPFNAQYTNSKDTPLTVEVPNGPYDLKLTK